MNATDLLTNENKYNLLAGRVPLLLNRYLGQQFKNEGINLTREQWSILARVSKIHHILTIGKSFAAGLNEWWNP